MRYNRHGNNCRCRHVVRGCKGKRKRIPPGGVNAPNVGKVGRQATGIMRVGNNVAKNRGKGRWRTCNGYWGTARWHQRGSKASARHNVQRDRCRWREYSVRVCARAAMRAGPQPLVNNRWSECCRSGGKNVSERRTGR